MIRVWAPLSIALFFASVGIAAGQSGSNWPESPPLPSTASLDVPAPARTSISASQVLPVVMDARIGEHPDRTRFVVEVSDPLQLRVFTLSDPDRVVIDMPEVLWRLDAPARPTGHGLVKSYRYGLFRAGNSRFVIDLNSAASVAVPMILPPEGGHGYRIVVDLFAQDQAKFARAAGWPPVMRLSQPGAASEPVMPTPASVSRLGAASSPQNSARRVVVLDAGHGGIDSGTTGVDGTMEKDLVLDEALRLRNVLSKRGYIVHVTRDSDVYIPLRERVNIARGFGADLFISLHADSNPDASVSGASVYTLSESGSDKEAAALARKENQSDVIAGVDLSGESSPVASILIGLAQRDTMNRSSRFAEGLVEELGHATNILPREPHRAAAFVVLKAPDIPAVLIELGYLSNAHDCSQVRTNSWRDGVASAIADAVDRNFATPGAISTAATTQSPE
ncbi:MAG: N-acetylmuramoyl-L-alanine amidase [Rhizomicrobium sp.]|jgi:N-acetylmuramoyl-L-alanine amidase